MEGTVSSPWTTPIITASLVGLVLFYVYTKISPLWTRDKRLPPGPCGWRLLKDLWRLAGGWAPQLVLEWARDFGPLTYVYTFSQPLCLINSPELTRKLMGGDEYKDLTANRVVSFSGKSAYDGKDLFFIPYDNVCKMKRKLFHKVLAMYGDGVESFENVVGEELDRLLDTLMKSDGKNVQMDTILSRSLQTVIYILMLGEHSPSIEPLLVMEEFDKALNDMLTVDANAILNAFPFVRFLPGKYRNRCRNLAYWRGRAEEVMYHNNKRTYIPGRIRGAADVLLELQAKPEYEWLTQQDIVGFLTFMFFASYITSRGTLLASFLLMAHKPEIARKIQAEIDSVLGERAARVEDRLDMPYTEAFFLEALRQQSTMPFIGTRTSPEDITIEGYLIPKGTQLNISTGFIHRDEKLWEDPWTFKPERFLDDEGKLLPGNHPKRKNLLSFGYGPRMCPGEVFARSRVFLFMTRILQRFDLLPPDNEELPSCEPSDYCGELVRQPPPFKFRLVPRQADKKSSP